VGSDWCAGFQCLLCANNRTLGNSLRRVSASGYQKSWRSGFKVSGRKRPVYAALQDAKL
jgi:hypothetical protein